MKIKMTCRFIVVILLFLAIGCKKDSPGVKGGCSFTFKGQSYTSIAVSCSKGSMSSTTGAWLISMDLNDNIIGFDLLNTNATSYVANATLSKSGSSVSFNTTVENSDGDSGALSGKCTCSQGAF